jgi:hypothetical protein
VLASIKVIRFLWFGSEPGLLSHHQYYFRRGFIPDR